jgi:hypothetical protein
MSKDKEFDWDKFKREESEHEYRQDKEIEYELRKLEEEE